MHDIDIAVTGTGEPGATVHIVTTGDSYQGQVNPDKSYSITIPPQEAGTIITATQTSADGIQSNETSTTVIGVILEFTVPEQLPFKNTPLGLQEFTIQRAVPNWSITVRDTRGQGSTWKITARAEGSLTSTDGNKLDPNALVYIKDSSINSLSEEVQIFNGITGVNKETTVQWSENEGELIKITPINLETGVAYSTIIDWTLNDAP